MKNTAGLKLIMGNLLNSEFTKEEAYELLYSTLILKEDQHEKLSINKIGVISGLVHINDELEVIVKFMDNLEQFTKRELEEKTILIKDEN